MGVPRKAAKNAVCYSGKKGRARVWRAKRRSYSLQPDRGESGRWIAVRSLLKVIFNSSTAGLVRARAETVFVEAATVGEPGIAR